MPDRRVCSHRVSPTGQEQFLRHHPCGSEGQRTGTSGCGLRVALTDPFWGHFTSADMFAEPLGLPSLRTRRELMRRHLAETVQKSRG